MKKYINRAILVYCLLLFAANAAAQSGLDQTAAQIAAQMAPGWNLGNTLEAPVASLDAETAWQPTRTTQSVIDFVKAQGFKSVRIPCSWHVHFDPGTTHINDAWMSRVKEVVDYCINDGLYVVLNDHWDGGWLENSFTDVSPANVEAKSDTLKMLWTQIAEAFRDYDEHLLFAGLNEPSHNQGEFSKEMMDALLAYEQAFVNTVRTTGGNNIRRVLIVQGPNTDIDQTCRHMDRLPEDVIADRLMLEVHYYTPWNFCGLEHDESWGTLFYYWGENNHVAASQRNSTWGEEAAMREQLLKMKTRYADRGIPVIIGEYGANWHQVQGKGENQKRHDASLRLFHREMNRLCREMGFVPMVWDINHTKRPTMSILDREHLRVFCQPAIKGITEAAK